MINTIGFRGSKLTRKYKLALIGARVLKRWSTIKTIYKSQVLSRWRKSVYEGKVFRKFVRKWERNEKFNLHNAFKLWVYETVRKLKRYENTRNALKILSKLVA